MMHHYLITSNLKKLQLDNREHLYRKMNFSKTIQQIKLYGRMDKSEKLNDQGQRQQKYKKLWNLVKTKKLQMKGQLKIQNLTLLIVFQQVLTKKFLNKFLQPDDRKLICNPNWREHCKQKWMNKKGFQTGLQINFFKNEQAWNELPIGSQRQNPYINGYYEIGHKFRKDESLKELQNSNHQVNKEFQISTKNDILYQHPNLLKSNTNRTLEAQLRLKDIQQYHHQTIEKKLKKQQEQSPPHSPTLSPTQAQAILIKVEDLLSNNGSKNNSDLYNNEIQVPCSKTPTQKLSTQRPSISETASYGMKKNFSQIQIETQISQMQIQYQVQQNKTTKNYFKSIERYIPFGYLNSNKIKTEQLSNKIQNMKVTKRPMTALQNTNRNVQSQILNQISQNEQLSEYSNRKFNDMQKSPSPRIDQIRPMTSDYQTRQQILCRPVSAITTSMQYERVYSPCKNRPQSGLYSSLSGIASTKISSSQSRASIMQDAINKHFDQQSKQQ